MPRLGAAGRRVAGFGTGPRLDHVTALRSDRLVILVARAGPLRGLALRPSRGALRGAALVAAALEEFEVVDLDPDHGRPGQRAAAGATKGHPAAVGTMIPGIPIVTLIA